MPVKVCLDNYQCELPTNSSRIPIKDLEQMVPDAFERETKDHILGTILQKHEFYKDPYPCIVLVLKDASGTVNLMSLNETAERVKDYASEGDTVVCSNFEDNTSGGDPVQTMVVDDQEEGFDPIVLIIPSSAYSLFHSPDEHEVEPAQGNSLENSSKGQEGMVFEVAFEPATTSLSNKKERASISIPSTSGKSPLSTVKTKSKGQSNEEATQLNVNMIQTTQGKKQKPYQYTPLAELSKMIGQKVNAYGIIVHHEEPRQSRGKDYICKIAIQDSSLDKDVFFWCNIFLSPTEWPKTVNIGDIIRLHRLKIESFMGKVLGTGSRKLGCSWLLFPRDSSHGTPVASSDRYSISPEESELRERLTKWYKLKVVRQDENESMTLAKVQPHKFVDLIAQIIQVAVVKIYKNCQLIRVWDGTKYNGELRCITPEETVESSSFSNELILKASKDLTVDIMLFDEHSHHKFTPGDFVMLKNLHAAVVNGRTELTLHGGGKYYSRGAHVLDADSPETQPVRDMIDILMAGYKTNSQGEEEAEPSKGKVVGMSSGDVHDGEERVGKGHGNKGKKKMEKIPSVIGSMCDNSDEEVESFSTERREKGEDKLSKGKKSSEKKTQANAASNVKSKYTTQRKEKKNNRSKGKNNNSKNRRSNPDSQGSITSSADTDYDYESVIRERCEQAQEFMDCFDPVKSANKRKVDIDEFRNNPNKTLNFYTREFATYTGKGQKFWHKYGKDAWISNERDKEGEAETEVEDEGEEITEPEVLDKRIERNKEQKIHSKLKEEDNEELDKQEHDTKKIKRSRKKAKGRKTSSKEKNKKGEKEEAEKRAEDREEKEKGEGQYEEKEEAEEGKQKLGKVRIYRKKTEGEESIKGGSGEFSCLENTFQSQNPNELLNTQSPLNKSIQNQEGICSGQDIQASSQESFVTADNEVASQDSLSQNCSQDSQSLFADVRKSLRSTPTLTLKSTLQSCSPTKKATSPGEKLYKSLFDDSSPDLFSNVDKKGHSKALCLNTDDVIPQTETHETGESLQPKSSYNSNTNESLSYESDKNESETSNNSQSSCETIRFSCEEDRESDETTVNKNIVSTTDHGGQLKPVKKVIALDAKKLPSLCKMNIKVLKIISKIQTPRDVLFLSCSRCLNLSVIPDNLSEPRHLRDLGCSSCPSLGIMELTLYVKLTVCDPFDVDVNFTLIINHKEAMRFFKVPNTWSLLKNEVEFRRIQKYLQVLCPLGQSITSKPTLECTVYSSISGPERTYILCDTDLKPEILFHSL